MVKTWSSYFRINWTCYLCDYLSHVLISLNCIYWQTTKREFLRNQWARKTKIPTIKPFQICQDSSSHRTTDNLSCLAASNTVKAWSRCLSQRWFPRQQEYDNVAIDMTEGIISLTNRDNRHREGWGKGRGGGWINGLIFTQRGKAAAVTHHPPSILHLHLLPSMYSCWQAYSRLPKGTASLHWKAKKQSVASGDCRGQISDGDYPSRLKLKNQVFSMLSITITRT